MPVGAGLDPVGGRTGLQEKETPDAVEVAANLLDHGEKVRMEDEDPRPRVVEDMAEVGGPETRVQREEDAAGQGDSVVGFQERVLVIRE